MAPQYRLPFESEIYELEEVLAKLDYMEAAIGRLSPDLWAGRARP